MGRDATKMGKAITTGITAPVVALTSSMVLLSNATGKYADQLLDLQQITGLSTDNLQGLEVIAEEAGVSFTGLTNTIAKFTSKIPELAKGTGASSDAIKQLGIDVFDSSGNVRDMNELFPEMINRLQGMEDITERNAISQQLFGKSLGDIAPVLSISKDRFNELLGSAENLSGFMSEDAIKSANDYRVMMENLKRTFGGFFRELSMNVIPILSDTLVPLLKDTIFPIIEGLVGVVGKLANWFNNLATPVKEFVVIFGAAIAVMGPMLLLFAKFVPLIKSAVAIYKVLTTAQVTLNAAMATNPIGLIVIGIAALIAAGVLLWKNWDTVKVKFVESWDFISFHFKNVATFIAKIYAKMILGILEGINKVGKFVPGLNKGLSLLIGTMKKGIAVLDAQTEARKSLRKEQQAAKKLTEEENKAIAAAKKLADDLNKTTNEATVITTKNTQAKKDNVKAAEDQAKAETKAAQARKEAADADFKISQQLAAAKSDLEDDVLTKLKMVTKQKLAQNEFEKSESLRIGSEKGLNLANITALYKAREDRIIKTSALQEVKIAESVKKQRISIAQKTLGAIQTVANGINSIWQAGLDRRIQELDMETEAKKVAIENSLLGEEEKALAIAAIDQEADAKKLELQKEDARRQKLASIMGIVLNTALAISAALTLPPPASFIMAGITAALGVAQLAIAVATPIPFAEGGLVRADPGTGVLAQIGEGKQDEMVVPMKTGAVELAKNIVGQMSGIGSDMVSRASGNGGETHLHIGTLIADEFGLKKLSKILNKYTVAENQRTGATA